MAMVESSTLLLLPLLSNSSFHMMMMMMMMMMLILIYRIAKRRLLRESWLEPEQCLFVLLCLLLVFGDTSRFSFVREQHRACFRIARIGLDWIDGN